MSLLAKLNETKLFKQLDIQFAKFINLKLKENNATIEEETIVTIAAAICSNELAKGHCCLSVQKIPTHPALLDLHVAPFVSNLPPQDTWTDVISESNVVTTGDKPALLVLSHGSIYLYNMYVYEQQIASKINVLTATQSNLLNKTAMTDTTIKNTLETLFKRPYSHLSTKLSDVISNADSDYFDVVADMLNIVDAKSLDIEAIAEVCRNAKSAEDLQKLDELIPSNACCDHQKTAAFTALQKSFAVISGGAGTGKTSTVVKFLALSIIAELAINNKTIRIDLAAPTGKAASRLTESITKAIDSIDVADNVKELIPRSATTLHKLLGYSYNSTKLKYNEDNKLNTDILVVDEASMVDVTQLFNCLCALKDGAKIVLLGDKNQLLSVDAGSILADICSFTSISEQQKKIVSEFTGNSVPLENGEDDMELKAISDSICFLKKSYRFDAKSGIGQLATAVNNGDFDKAVNICESSVFNDVELKDVSADSFDDLITRSTDLYSHYFEMIKNGENPREILNEFNKIRVLCAVRTGVFGIYNINSNIEKELSSREIIKKDGASWYNGKPIMITKNDSITKLSNGDIGIAIYDENSQNIFIHIEMSDGTIKRFLPSRIPAHETAYAMTIHKSQGSEFDHTFTIFPTKALPLLTRELIYTAITRAKKHYTLYSPKDILKRSIKTRTVRNSNLHRLLK